MKKLIAIAASLCALLLLFSSCKKQNPQEDQVVCTRDNGLDQQFYYAFEEAGFSKTEDRVYYLKGERGGILAGICHVR